MQVKVVLNYAVNGTGVGHISRLVAINRHLRAIARESGNRVESVFLTTSEAVGMLHAENFERIRFPPIRPLPVTGSVMRGIAISLARLVCSLSRTSHPIC
jgi:predicted glycosyltransferase